MTEILLLLLLPALQCFHRWKKNKKERDTEDLQSPGRREWEGDNCKDFSLHESFPSFTESRAMAALNHDSPVKAPSISSVNRCIALVFSFNCTCNQPPTAFKKRSRGLGVRWSTAASYAFNQKMQLTEPILHSPFTPLHSTPLHLLSPPLPLPSLSLGPGCHQNAGPVWRTTHRVIINKRRWQVNIPPEC